MDQSKYSRPLKLANVKIDDGFWKDEMELVRKEIIPYQWEALNDRVEGAAPSYCMRNFKLAAKLNDDRKNNPAFVEPKYEMDRLETLPEKPGELDDKFYGFLFQDTDFYKWIEAVGYSLIAHPDAELEKRADEAIEIVKHAQQENGYLDTYYILNGQDAIFTNLRDNHELYCLGHLLEGAVAYYEATGKNELLKVAMKYADFVEGYFGEDKCKGYPGHEIAEMALIRLYDVTGDEKYKKLSKYFIDERGQEPLYFENSETHINKTNADYHQAGAPVRDQKEATGHSVRAVYLYSGMADVARVYNDDKLFEACETLWKNMVEQKMYITGGIGATHLGEAFSFNYDLPNDTAYTETCAAIGLVFFCRRMLEIKPDSKYADIMELALYNGVLSGMALDGKSFFYVNPLEVLPEACHKDERKFHVKPVRQKWFGCACCPPNLARLLSSIGAYAFTERVAEEGTDTLFIHQYIGAEATMANDAKVKIETEMPWNGKVKLTMNLQDMEGEKAGKPFTVALRIPGWCQNFDYSIKKLNGEAEEVKKEDGYLYITKLWEDGEEVKLNLGMSVQILEADTRIREDIGKVAVKHGPIVYCVEEADNGADLHMLSLDIFSEPAVSDFDICGTKVKMIDLLGVRRKPNYVETGMPYKMVKNVEMEDVVIKFVPYYTWANRGENEMRVWVN